MSKKNKILIVIFVALIFAALAGYSIYTYLTPMKATIYVYNNDYEAGTTITSDMFTPILVDSKIVENGRQASINERYIATANDFNYVVNSGDTLLVNVYKGQTLTRSDMSVESGTAIEKNLATNAIAVTINVNNTTGVTKGLRIGSRVNIYSSYEGITSLLLQSMRIIKVNTGDNGLTSVTLECSQQEAVKLIYASEYTSVHFGLINENGYEPSSTDVSYGVYEG